MADQEKQLDYLLDSLLANYADVEPRPGFETRLLAALHEPKPALRFGWLWAGAVAAVMATAGFAIYSLRLAELPPPPRIHAAAPPVLPAPEIVGRHKMSRQRLQSQVEPPQVASNVDLRQEVFPTPNPLSEQERLLLQYLAGTPRDEVVTHAREDEPAEKEAPDVPESQRINGSGIFNTR